MAQLLKQRHGPRPAGPDEIMQFSPDRQLLGVQGQAAAVAQKLRDYAHPELDGLFTTKAG